MTANDIQRKLMVEYRQSMFLPNYTPVNWWECDVIELTKAGYMREFEIKLSKADFKADASKAKTRYVPRDEPIGGRHFDQKLEKKHDLLAVRDQRGPVEFYYCTPRGLITDFDVPEWAGWMEFYEGDKWEGKPQPFPCNIHYERKKTAPRLHRQKANPAIREHMLSVCYYRFTELFVFKGQGQAIVESAQLRDQVSPVPSSSVEAAPPSPQST